MSNDFMVFFQVDGEYLCLDCSLPMCDKECSESGVHKKAECGLFKVLNPKVKIEFFDRPHPFYSSIAPLRCLLLKDEDPSSWSAIEVGQIRKFQ